MRSFFRHDAVKVLLYLCGTVVMAYLLTPWLDRFASALQEIAGGKQTNFFLRTVAEWSGQATLVDSFRCSLCLSALALLPILVVYLGGAVPYSLQSRPWQLFISAQQKTPSGQTCRPVDGLFFRSFFVACLVALIAFALAMILLHSADFSHLVWPLSWPQWCMPLLIALVAAVVLEWLLRGVLLGIFLRTFSAPVAIVLVAFLGALGYFLHAPPTWVDPSEVTTQSSGQVVIALLHYAMEPQRLVGIFVPWIVAGMFLGVIRYRTRSLAWPMGWQVGWSCCSAMVVTLGIAPSPVVTLNPSISLQSLVLLGALASCVILVSWLSPRVAHE